MSANIIANLDTLPVELLYHICEFSDAKTILLSFRYVSRRFYIISNVYNQYRLNLSLCRKHQFYHLCHVINPLNIVSLTLSDDDKTPGQIDLFLSCFNFQQFHCLRSLTLLQVDDSNLNIIFKDLSSLLLTSLTVISRTLFTWTQQTFSCLSIVLEKSSLKDFTLSIWCFEIHDFIWPNQCDIEYLQISNRITMEQYCTILERCSHLRTLIIKDVLWNDTDMTISTTYCQLKSLTLEDNRMDMYKLEEFLSLTPSLYYLKVIGMAYLIESYRWEAFFQRKLPNLNKFEFFFLSWKNVNYDVSDVESLIEPFKTSFWLEIKKWPVQCDYIINPTEVVIYSIPICKSFFQYHEPSNKISCTNFTTINTDQYQMDYVSQLRVNLATAIDQDNIVEKTQSLPCPLFRNTTELTLDIDYKCLLSVSKPLVHVIDPLSITQLSLNLNYDFADDLHTLTNLINIFSHLSKLQTLAICNNLPSMTSNTTIEDICLLIPAAIEHLKITVKNLNEMKVVFDRCQHLSSIDFRFLFDTSMPSTKIVESFLNVNNDFTYRKDDSSIRIWLDNIS